MPRQSETGDSGDDRRAAIRGLETIRTKPNPALVRDDRRSKKIFFGFGRRRGEPHSDKYLSPPSSPPLILSSFPPPHLLFSTRSGPHSLFCFSCFLLCDRPENRPALAYSHLSFRCVLDSRRSTLVGQPLISVIPIRKNSFLFF